MYVKHCTWKCGKVRNLDIREYFCGVTVDMSFGLESEIVYATSV